MVFIIADYRSKSNCLTVDKQRGHTKLRPIKIVMNLIHNDEVEKKDISKKRDIS